MKGLIIVVVLALVVLVGFTIFGSITGEVGPDVAAIELSVSGLEPLERGHYQAWILTEKEYIGLGKFDIEESISFELPDEMNTEGVFVVTIEADNEDSLTPSDIVVLRGVIEEDGADLVFPIDLTNINGSYELATPTDKDKNNERSGVWFADLAGPEASLNLVELPMGWVYEGWVVHNDIPLSMGRFVSTTGADDFSGYSGAVTAPDFPGEDFLENDPQGMEFPIDLTDGSSLVVISLEPDIDGRDPTGDSPFFIKPLTANIPEDAKPHFYQDMQVNIGSLPRGFVIITP